MPAWKELKGSPHENYADDGFKATRTFLTAWSDRTALAGTLLGNGIAGTGFLEPAVRYPLFTNVQCTNVNIEPFTDDVTPQDLVDLNVDLNSYESFAKVTASYENINLGQAKPDSFDIEAPEGTYFSYTKDLSVSHMIMASTWPIWDSDSKVPQEIDVKYTKVIPITTHNLTWHRLLDPPYDTFRAIVGRVNRDEFLGAAFGTLMFMGATQTKDWAFKGDFDDIKPAWKLGLVFKEKRILDGETVHGWNFYYRSLPRAKKGWARMEQSNGLPWYPSATFSRLIQLVDPGET